jgi:hypothetical protein
MYLYRNKMHVVNKLPVQDELRLLLNDKNKHKTATSLLSLLHYKAVQMKYRENKKILPRHLSVL